MYASTVHQYIKYKFVLILLFALYFSWKTPVTHWILITHRSSHTGHVCTFS